MPAHALRHQLLLSTTMIVGALTGYASRAYAACVNTGGSTYQCSGAELTQQTIAANNASVSTVAGFSVITGDAIGVSITGNGAISYTDANNSTLSAATTALSIHSTGDELPTQGSVAVNTDGTLTAYTYGIEARNQGGGAVTVTAYGGVTATNGRAIFARNESGTSINVTTGAASTITGGDRGIVAYNLGTGEVTVTADGGTYGNTNEGILAVTINGTNINVMTGASSTVVGATHGVSATSAGSGTVTVTADGIVDGSADNGIYAVNYGTDINVTTGVGSTVTGADSGIHALSYGSGAITVTANGLVDGSLQKGIFARNNVGTNISVTTGAGTDVTGASYGIAAYNLGSGAVTVTANGNVTGGTKEGIFAANLSGTTVSVTTGADTNVTGTSGIAAGNGGSGAVTVTVNGNVTGTDKNGIYAGSAGAPINIAVGSAATVTGNSAFAIATADGPSTVTVAGILNGGGDGAVQFDQTNPFTNNLKLVTGATVNGNVIGGSGTDTLTLLGANTGAFNVGQLQNFEAIDVEAGTWSLSGVTTANAQVNGGTLKGNGTFGDLTVNGGTLAPGNSIGTLTVNGMFTLGSGAVYEVEVNAQGQSDKVIVKGTVNLTGATLRVLAANGNYKPETDYVIIENDGSDAVNGTFASVTSNLAFLIPTVIYNGGTGNDVVLTLERNEVDPCDVANTPDERATCNAIDPSNPLFPYILNQTAEGARQAFEALSGEIHATLSGVLADDSRYVREAVLSRLVQATYSNNSGQIASLGAGGPQVASLNSSAMALGHGYGGKSLVEPAPSPLAFWTRAYGAWGNFNGDGNAGTANRNLGGFVSGMDAKIGGSWRVGLATGASFSNVAVDARYSSAEVDSYHLGGYLGGMAGAFALRGGGMWAWSDIDTSRAVIFPGFYEREKAAYNEDTGQIFGEMAYPTQMWGAGLEPFAGLAYVSESSGTFHEHGGTLARLRGSIDQDVGYTTVGLRAGLTLRWSGMTVTPNGSVAWLHAFSGVTPDARLAFADTGIGFTVYGVPLAQDSALLDAGLDLSLGPRTTAGVSYSGQIAHNAHDNAVKGRFTWLF